MKRFRWTRELYKRAHHLNRFMPRVCSYAEAPSLVRQFWALWEHHQQGNDPLLTHISWRYDRDDIPF